MAEDTELYSFGKDYKAEDRFKDLDTGSRQSVIHKGREMANLTIPNVFPPEGYKAGDDLPGTNQSINALALNSLASALMFMAFPPNQPILRYAVRTTQMQDEIDEDPELYGRLILAMAQLEIAHRERFQATAMASVYVGFIKQLLVSGNALWRHITLNTPTFHRPDQYVVERDGEGNPLQVILKETTKWMALSEDHKEQLKEKLRDKLKGNEKEDRELCLDIYSCQRLITGKTNRDEDKSWAYWQEIEGVCLEDTEVETDFDNAPMWPAWLVPVFGDNWGTGYCEEFEGDLLSIEALSSSLNDGASLAALALLFVNPGATSIKQVREARNLSVLPGQAGDVSVFRSEKGQDLSFVDAHLEKIARRVSQAFLMQESIQRSGERVTAEEIRRLGAAIDKALGGLYTELSQGTQQRVVTRGTKLHEDEDPTIPEMPKEVFSLKVITGTDAMGNSADFDNLVEYASVGMKIFPQSFEASHNPNAFFTRLAAAKGVKPDGLVKSEKQVAADMEANQQQQMMSQLVDKGAGPAVKGIVDAANSQMGGGAEAPPPQQ